MSTSTIGRSIGAAIGKGAAYTAHGAIRAAQGTGRFGQDVLAGTTEGYTSKAAAPPPPRERTASSRGNAPVAITVPERRATAEA